MVVDTSIMFSFFKSDSARRHLIKEISARGCRLVSLDFFMEELLREKEKILQEASARFSR